MEMKRYRRGEAGYPSRLAPLEGAPSLLYALGELPTEERTVAIVGARECTHYGRKMAWEYARALAGEGVGIISGLARGIDAAAHEGALKGGGRTYAVMGCGADVCYPPGNRGLYGEILERGGILSEFEPGTPPRAWHFPVRNRIISGLADLVLVVEARRRSGSLITADAALAQGKDVYALPGRVGDSLSEGCNRLIAQGAGIAWSPEEILCALFHREFPAGEGVEESVENFPKKNKTGLAREEKKVYSCISLQPKHVNEISRECGMEFGRTLGVLYDLEARGLVEELAKNHFVAAEVK